MEDRVATEECEEDVSHGIDTLKRVSKELKRLQFANPGPQTSVGCSDNKRLRERTQLFNYPQTQSNYAYIASSHAHHVSSSAPLSARRINALEADTGHLCDCLHGDCPGCFLPCAVCRSNKCGVVCRLGREWSYSKQLTCDQYIEALCSQ